MVKNKGCCDLKYAKKLDELGVKQESLWYWAKPDLRGFVNRKRDEIWAIQNNGCLYWRGAAVYSAFTVAELGESLPNSIYYKDCWYYYREYKNQARGKEYSLVQYRSNGDTVLHDANDTQANARAKMRIWLIEKGITKICK